MQAKNCAHIHEAMVWKPVYFNYCTSGCRRNEDNPSQSPGKSPVLAVAYLSVKITSRNKNVITSCFPSPESIAVRFKLCCWFLWCEHRTKGTEEYSFHCLLQYARYPGLQPPGCFQHGFLKCPLVCHDPGISQVNMLMSIFDAHVHLVVLQSSDWPQLLRSGDVPGSLGLRCPEHPTCDELVRIPVSQHSGWKLQPDFSGAKGSSRVPHLSWLSSQYTPYRKLLLGISWLFKR